MNSTIKKRYPKENTNVFFSIEKIYTWSSIRVKLKKILRLTIITFKKMMYASSLILSLLTTIMVFNWKWTFLHNYVNLSQYCFVVAAFFFINLSIYVSAFVIRELCFERGYLK